MVIKILPLAQSEDQHPTRPADPDRILVRDMDTLVQAGEAHPLFPEFDIGPIWYGGVWWGVPQGPGEFDRGYAVASDDAHLELTELLLVLQRSAEVTAAIQQERSREAAIARSDDPWPRRPARLRRWWGR